MKEPIDYFELAKGLAQHDIRRYRSVSDAERMAYEAQVRQFRDVIAAQDKLIQEMQDLIEILRKAQA